MSHSSKEWVEQVTSPEKLCLDRAFAGKAPAFMRAKIESAPETQTQPHSLRARTNAEARAMFQTQASAQATDLASVIHRLESVPSGTKLRLQLDAIDALLQIEGQGHHKKIRMLFTSRGTWRVDCFTRLPVHLLKVRYYPTWLDAPQRQLYKKLKQLRKRAYAAKV